MNRSEMIAQLQQEIVELHAALSSIAATATALELAQIDGATAASQIEAALAAAPPQSFSE
jgi:hypothetical protein